MDEKLKVNYETYSKQTAYDTVRAFIKGGQIEAAKDFAQKAIEDWQLEGKEPMVTEYIYWLRERGITIDAGE